jgi:hypothetical protein
VRPNQTLRGPRKPEEERLHKARGKKRRDDVDRRIHISVYALV